MSEKTIIDGRIIKKYKIPLDEIEELNFEFDLKKDKLISDSERLAGRIETEKSIVTFIQSLKIFDTLVSNMNKYILALNHFDLYSKQVNIILHTLTMMERDGQQFYF